jgi:cell division protein FtsW (lipid II flippase)
LSPPRRLRKKRTAALAALRFVCALLAVSLWEALLLLLLLLLVVVVVLLLLQERTIDAASSWTGP